MGKLTAQKVKDNGSDSVFAKGGADLRNNEFMIYEGQKCTIRYIVEIK